MSSAGLPTRFVQDNISISGRGVVRGLHLQHPNGQGKLVRAVAGRILDVSVDVRVGSPAFGLWFGIELGEDDGTVVYIPPGVAHGFAVLSDRAVVSYKCTAYYEPLRELTIRWDDPKLAIQWPVNDAVLSEKDRNAPLLTEIAPDRLPVYHANARE